jgi:hypothetical protein
LDFGRQLLKAPADYHRMITVLITLALDSARLVAAQADRTRAGYPPSSSATASNVATDHINPRDVAEGLEMGLSATL